MRRPILGNGFPKVIPLLSASPDGLAVLNLQTLPAEAQDRVHLLTLFVTPVLAPTATTVTLLQQNKALDPQIPFSVTDISLQPAGVPIPLLNRFAIRGPQRIAIALSVAPVAAVDVRVFGFFELEASEIPDVQGARPLNNVAVPVKPFLGGIRLFAGGGAGTVAHILSNEYVDQITLDATIADSSFGVLQLQGEDDYPIRNATSLTRILDGIPMRSQYPLKINAAEGAGFYTGTFKRD